MRQPHRCCGARDMAPRWDHHVADGFVNVVGLPQRVERGKHGFGVRLINDAAGPVQVDVANVYVDNKPVVPENAEPISLDRRGDIEIRLSDVASSFVEAGNSYLFATIGPKS